MDQFWVGIDQLLNWMVARMPMWQGRVMGVPPAEAASLVVRAKRIYAEELLCEPYPRQTPVSVKTTAARGVAVAFLVSEYLERLAHEKITADYRAMVRSLRRRDESCTAYEVVLGVICFLYQQDQGSPPPSLALTCQELDLPAVDQGHQRHVRAVATLVNRLWVQNHRVRPR